MSARKVVGARALIGDEAIAAGESYGVGVMAKSTGANEVLDPWTPGGMPPWQASYANAVNQLAMLRAASAKKMGGPRRGAQLRGTQQQITTLNELGRVERKSSKTM